MNVAVGGTSGWFAEGEGDKPWFNRADREFLFLFFYLEFLLMCVVDPMKDFAKASPKWYQSWPTNLDDRAMIMYVEKKKFLIFVF